MTDAIKRLRDAAWDEYGQPLGASQGNLVVELAEAERILTDVVAAERARIVAQLRDDWPFVQVSLDHAIAIVKRGGSHD